MLKNKFWTIVFALFVPAALSCASFQARAQDAKNPYPAMAPLEQYLMPEQAEIALARSAAPGSISGAADVMVLRKSGDVTVVKGSNGFVCMVERAWAKPTDDPEFWNPKMRAPTCFNAAAAETFLTTYLMKTKLVLAGKSKAEILALSSAALDKKELPALAPGAMAYMMSKEQNLGDQDSHWHPHLMFMVPGNAEKSWGGNLAGSPVMAGNDPEERVTIFFVVVEHWSDGSPGPMMKD